jgi:integrase
MNGSRKGGIMDSRTEFCTYIKNRIITKLTEAGEYELLCFALFGIELGLRQGDILKLEWNQVDLKDEIIKNVYQTKLSNQREIPVCFDYNLTDDLICALIKLYNKTNDKGLIFPNIKRYSSAKKIGELIGDTYFSIHELRSMGIVLKYSSLVAVETE